MSTTTEGAAQSSLMNGTGTALAAADTKEALHKIPQASTELFAGAADWSTAQRIATALSNSSLVPKEYQGNMPNVLIAMEIAGRVKASVFSVMQSLDIIHGRPSWRAQFLIATVNSSGRFTPLRYRFQGAHGSKEWGCRAVACDVKSGEELIGPLVTIQLAHDEGWATKTGSKWKTGLAELMLMYRSAGFWTRVYAPELSLGMQTAEELHDVLGTDTQSLPQQLMPSSPASLEAALGLPPRASAIDTQGETIDRETGEVHAALKSEAEPVQQSLDTATKRSRS